MGNTVHQGSRSGRGSGPRVVYAVTAEISDRATAERYVAWLLGSGAEFTGKPGHAAQVLAWGGTLAEITEIDGEGGDAGVVRVECRYEFPGRAALERYLGEGAPALREEGQRLFLESGKVRLSRRIGRVVGVVRV